MIEFGIAFAAVVLIAGAGAAVSIMGKTPEILDENKILHDYLAIRKATVQHKKEYGKFALEISELKDAIDGSKVNIKPYQLSEDGQYLMLKDCSAADCNRIIDQIGGTSYHKGHKLYMSFKSSSFLETKLPVAAFSIYPDGKITTMTKLWYDHSKSSIEEGEIADMEWVGKSDAFSKAGIHKVKLRIKDKYGHWSEWCEKELEVTEPTGIAKIITRNDQIAVSYKNGQLRLKGSNHYGEMGTGKKTSLEDFEFVPRYNKIKQVALGDGFILARDIFGNVWSCGKNDLGQLGQGDRLERLIPTAIWGLTNIGQVEASKNFTGALNKKGDLYMWGVNEHYQLASESFRMKEMPRHVGGLDPIRRVAFGEGHVLALMYDETVYTWGDNTNGQLGLGYKCKNHADPTQLGLTGVKKVFAGYNVSYAITKENVVYGWGSNGYGHLLLDEMQDQQEPVEIPDLKDIVKISIMEKAAVAMDIHGQVYAWGRIDSEEPLLISKVKKIEGLENIKDISTNKWSTYALSKDDRLFKFKYNNANVEEILFENNPDIIEDNLEKSQKS